MTMPSQPEAVMVEKAVGTRAVVNLIYGRRRRVGQLSI